eukprot:9468421-Pyramimonas_sp.AAC.1
MEAQMRTRVCCAAPSVWITRSLHAPPEARFRIAKTGRAKAAGIYLGCAQKAGWMVGLESRAS